MTRFELKLKIEMPTEMTDLPSIDVYKDGKLIEAHEGIYAEDLYNVIVGRCHLYDDIRMIKEDNDWSAECREKLAYYEDLEERIYSIFEDITIEMIVGEIESEYNKSIETILSLCKKLKEMTK